MSTDRSVEDNGSDDLEDYVKERSARDPAFREALRKEEQRDRLKRLHGGKPQGK